jgi:5-formyltetrahydrofolate cyclo-ligase
VTPADLSPADAKAVLRGERRAARRARGDADRAHAAGLIAARVMATVSNSSVVGCYLSMPTEPGTDALIDLLRQRDIRVLVPRVNGHALEWIELTDSTAFTISDLGIREPAGEALDDALSTCSAIVIPALAVSPEGVRLGQGGGFYDRALEAVPSHADGGPVRIAVIFDDELLQHVPREPHDSTVDLVITPERSLSF